MVHPRPQTPQGESVAQPATPLLIILSIACKYEVHGNLFSPLFEIKVRGQKHPRNSIPNISQYITIKDCQHQAYDNQCPRRAGHHRPSLTPSVDTYLHVTSDIKDPNTQLYIHTRTNYHNSPSQTKGLQEETHFPPHRFRCLLLYML